MDDLVQREINRITGQSGQTETEGEKKPSMSKLKDERVSKSPGKKALEKFFDVDISQIKKDLRTEAKKKSFMAMGELLNFVVDLIFFKRGGSTQQKNYGNNVITRSYTNGNYIPYNNASKPSQAPKSGPKYTFSDLIFAQRSQAQHLLDMMQEAVSGGGSLSVAELYDALDDPSNLEPTDNNFGWRDLSGAYIAEEGGVYRLYLPQVISLR